MSWGEVGARSEAMQPIQKPRGHLDTPECRSVSELIHPLHTEWSAEEEEGGRKRGFPCCFWPNKQILEDSLNYNIFN